MCDLNIDKDIRLSVYFFYLYTIWNFKSDITLILKLFPDFSSI